MGDKNTLPTRDGIATGKANERQMLERGGMDSSGFRTDIRSHADGSETLLRTRGGNPEFLTVAAQRPVGGQPVARGFVAHAFGKSYGALFDPYTLAIEDKRFSIRFAYYHVSSVAASAYAPRNWLDVWSWDGATMRINGQLARTFFPVQVSFGGQQGHSVPAHVAVGADLWRQVAEQRFSEAHLCHRAGVCGDFHGSKMGFGDCSVETVSRSSKVGKQGAGVRAGYQPIDA
jgi:hypothetical protein